ncbi:P-loop containing nucleoside triphosphate hydrolase [Phytophthora cactorum]|nr:P-loop containing nucleoside triphosphate hydrolase [Phytophthora cactorum]
MDVGTNVWVKTKDAAVWAPGEVVDYQDASGIVQVRRLDTDDICCVSNKSVTLTFCHLPGRYPGFDDELCLRNMSANFPAMSSLTSLEHLHEPALLQALSERFDHDQIYTSIGDILVALNPLKSLPKLYSETQLNAYKQFMTNSNPTSVRDELPPHVFAIGGKAFGGLLKPERRNQSILVSGESGSGKTESTKFLMQFLTSVGRDQSGTEQEGSDAVEIGKIILQTNPILESFGNAQTIRNDNSSRFGKFIKIQFGQKNEIVGAQIVSYLLEKVRLLHQNPEERSFHIFYELLEGADKELLGVLGLQKGGKYELLNSYGPILHGNELWRTSTRSSDNGQEDATAVTAASRFHLEKCAELMGVDVNKLETLLSSREIKAGVEVMVLKHNPEQAKEICGSLAKAIYGRLFTWLVRRLSDEINYFDSAISISDEDEELATIGILDIFGFESLNRNGFEQLCINYANERLQAQFNEFVFVREQQVYIAEGIDWTNISYPSNAACLALFDDKSNGLFSLLDQECLMPKGSNQALSTKFYRYHGGEDRLMERVNHQFVVHHFAGHVCYNVEQFVEKNTDALPADASDILSSSSNEVVVAIGADENVDSQCVSAVQESARPSYFQIGRTEAHYVRCLKPNEVKKLVLLEDGVEREEKNPGALTAATDDGSGTAFENEFAVGRAVLQKHYRGYRRRVLYQELRGFVVHVQAMFEVSWKETMDKLRQLRREHAATYIQACWRRFVVQRKRFVAQQILAEMLRDKRKRASAIRIQANVRRWLAQRTLAGLRKQKLRVTAAICIQRNCRCWWHSWNLLDFASDSSRSLLLCAFKRNADQSEVPHVKIIGLPVTQSSSEQDDSSTGDDRMEPPIRISAPTHRRTNSRQRSRANSRRSRTSSSHVDDRNSLLENEILRLQQMLVEQQNGSDKIEELDAKCKFLEQLVARKNYEDAARESFMYGRGSFGGRERFPSADGSLYGDTPPSEAGSDVDSIIFNIQSQMNMLRQSIAVKEQVLQTSRKSHAMSFSSSTRPTRSSSAASTMSFSNLPMGEAPPSLPSLPLSESQLSAGGSSHGNGPRSNGSSLGLPPTPTSSVASSFYQGPPRSAPAHFGGRGMPRIVKWARSTNCYECEEPFNLFVRRHHCRMCGNSFCHEHSSRRVSVFGIGFDDEPVRVCDNCFAEYYAASQEPQYPPQYGFSSVH